MPFSDKTALRLLFELNKFQLQTRRVVRMSLKKLR